ncbi:ParB/RepB/Spo0J family partition protein [Tautonia plasticadhaerens]|uniref:Chromosome-partitioning protein Spo0J n=1 Tax=Tautonia plasticadhaerens TaxID=2527974 RepID=A0A518H2C4_9BACT|nr:ParB/RepB/Spo0J family partition protein [Tautonia plasticadhaerens]QDV34967.1 Chromosome-partitioning protein Spo0J [Tautonia plasticadhaerens]
MTAQTIEVKKLSKSPLNVRRGSSSKSPLDEMKASILAHGLMQNLTAYPGKKGKYFVSAGSRRLEALQALIAEGQLPEDHAVPCLIVTEEQAQEMSLAENMVRLAMHPADEFEAFAALVEKSETAEQIGQRFGKTEKHVLQRLKLGRVAPELLEEYREGKLKLEVLEAFTITDDRKRQLKVYKQVKNGWQIHHASEIRSLLTDKMAKADSKLTAFVGLEAYQAAGGKTRSDLFGEDVYLEDMTLLHRLAGEKLEAEAEKLRADGWGWVEADFEGDYSTLSKFGRIQPVPLDAPADLMAELEAAKAEEQRIEDAIDATEDDDELESLYEQCRLAEEKREAVEEKLESFTDFDPEQKKLAGCFVRVVWGGRLSIDKGLVKPEDKKAAATAQASSDEEDSEESAPAKPALSQALIDDLKAYRTQVAQVAIAENPAIAFDLLVVTAARKVLTSQGGFDGANVSFNQSYPRPSGGEQTAAAARLEAIREALPLAWLREKTEAAQLAAFQRLDEADKHRILAYCTAMTLQPKLAPGAGKQRTVYDAALAQTGVNVAAYWRPTAANFFGRIKIGQLLEVGERVLGALWVSHRRNSKRAALVTQLNEAFAEPQTHGKTPEQVEALRQWLPEGMAFGAEEAKAVAEAA